MVDTLSFLDFGTYSVRFRYLPWPVAGGIYVALSLMVVFLAWKSLAWIGSARRAGIIGIRLIVMYLLVLLLAGTEATQRSDDLAVMVLQDVSESVRRTGTQADISETIETAIRDSTMNKLPGDRIGSITFDAQARVESLPRPEYNLAGRSTRQSRAGTSLAQAMQLAMASFDGQSMKRIVLVSDGNDTEGGLDQALTNLAAARVPVDVVPIQYKITNEIVLDRLVAPPWRREGEPFDLQIVLRNQGMKDAAGSLTVTHQELPVDLDAETPGVQPTRPATLQPGTNVIRVSVPATTHNGIHRFRAHFTPVTGDTLSTNNSAEAFTVVRGRGRVLYVDNFPNAEGRMLLEALRREGIGIDDEDHIAPHSFPSQLVQLLNYDAIILGNIPRGPGGITDDQAQLLAAYAKDTGGGIVVLGGPDALGAGNWQNTAFASILPVNLEVPARRITQGGAIVIAIDQSGSMSGTMPGWPTQKIASAQQSALLAINGLLPADLVGVIAFDDATRWVFPLQKRGNHSGAADAIRNLGAGGGTNIHPALEAATTELTKLKPSEAGVKHILLLTDGRTVPADFDPLLRRMNDAKITLSTIAIGSNADIPLLRQLASATDGNSYVVNDATSLTQVFVREARTIRRSLITEPEGGVQVRPTPAPAEMLAGIDTSTLPPLDGLVVTSRRNDPNAHVSLVTANEHADPVLAAWQHGLGKVVVFSSSPTRRWAPAWVASPSYSKFWAQIVRSISRSPMSGDIETQMIREGTSTRIIVDALDAHGAINGLTITGNAVTPDHQGASIPLRLTQISPGRYETTLPTPDAGTYVTALQYARPDGRRGSVVAGLAISESIEHRAFETDHAMLQTIAHRTGGRILPALGDASAYDLFDRSNVADVIAYLPINTLLLTLLTGLLIADVAIRRVQIDRTTLAAFVGVPLAWIRSYTTTRKVETTGSLDALRRVRSETTKTETPITPPQPVSTRKFEAKTEVSGDITQVVSGASDKPLPPAPKKSTPKADPSQSSHTSSLLEAKRRAQQKMKDQESDGN